MFIKHYFIFILLVTVTSLSGWTFFKPVSRNPLEQFKQHAKKVVTIILDPAGQIDGQARLIDGVPERIITYQFAQELKRILESNNQYLRIIILKDTAKNAAPYERVSAANSTNSNLYIHIQAFSTPQRPYPVYVYHMLYNVTDTWSSREKSLSFMPIDNSHKQSIKNTIIYGKSLCAGLIDIQKDNDIRCIGLFGIPFRPLMGITAPALAIEMGFSHKDDYQKLVEPIAKSLEEIISIINNRNANNDDSTTQTVSYILPD